MPGTWDGKTRPTSETYRSNYDNIFKRKDNMLIRLMFEPEPGVKCNVDKMFRCYAENYLSDFHEFHWGGFIMMNVVEHKYTKTLNGEPFYQFVASDVSDDLLKQIGEYVKANPMYGYYTHIHYSVNGENERALNYEGTPYTRGEGI